MSMMAEFFDVTKDSKDIFEDTYIAQSEYVFYMNQYPTIFLSFANLKGNKCNIIKDLKICLLKEYKKWKHAIIIEDEFDELLYQDVLSCIKNFNNESMSGIQNSLTFLMDCLYAYYGKRVMVIIDEYDTPFIHAKMSGCYDEIRSGLSEMLRQALKLSNSLQYAMLTGIQRVAKENIFSGFNNLDVYTVRDKQYASYFGFTNEEVFTRVYQQLLLTIPSYHDLTSENSYHMFFVGLCIWFTKEYEIISN